MVALPVPADRRSALRTLDWFVRTHVLRQSQLTCRLEPLGLAVTAYSRDLVGRHLYKRGTYEEILSGFVLCQLQLRADAVVLDIGANLGWYSLLLARRFPELQVHAFEPERRNFELLRRNIAQNGFGNVHAHDLAVAESTGEKQLYPYAVKNMGRHSLLPINDSAPVTVRSVSIDDFLAERHIDPKRVGFVKIDIEGYEEPAFRGAASVLAAGPPILAEYAPKYIRAGGGDPARYVAILRDAGYQPFCIARTGPQAFRLEPLPVADLAGDVRLDLLWQR